MEKFKYSLLDVNAEKECRGKTIPKAEWDDVVYEAKALMSVYENGNRGGMTEEEYRHLQKIASGFVPFECKVV